METKRSAMDRNFSAQHLTDVPPPKACMLTATSTSNFENWGLFNVLLAVNLADLKMRAGLEKEIQPFSKLDPLPTYMKLGWHSLYLGSDLLSLIVVASWGGGLLGWSGGDCIIVCQIDNFNSHYNYIYLLILYTDSCTDRFL